MTQGGETPPQGATSKAQLCGSCRVRLTQPRLLPGQSRWPASAHTQGRRKGPEGRRERERQAAAAERAAVGTLLKAPGPGRGCRDSGKERWAPSSHGKGWAAPLGPSWAPRRLLQPKLGPWLTGQRWSQGPQPALGKLRPHLRPRREAAGHRPVGMFQKWCQLWGQSTGKAAAQGRLGSKDPPPPRW